MVEPPEVAASIPESAAVLPEAPALSTELQAIDADSELDEPFSEPTDFTLEPPPVPIRRVDDTPEPVRRGVAAETFVFSDEPTVVTAPVRRAAPQRRRTPVAVWVAGTLLLVAALAMGGVLLGGSVESAAPAPAEHRPGPVAPPRLEPQPTPVDQAAAPPQAVAPEPAAKVVSPAEQVSPPRRKPKRAPARQQAGEGSPPIASVRPADEAPPPAVVRPRTTPEPASPPEAAASADAVNPWVELAD